MVLSVWEVRAEIFTNIANAVPRHCHYFLEGYNHSVTVPKYLFGTGTFVSTTFSGRYHKKLENFWDETGTSTKWDHTSKKLESVEAQIEMAWDSLKDADEGGCSLGSHKLTEVILGYWLSHSEPSKNVKH